MPKGRPLLTYPAKMTSQLFRRSHSVCSRAWRSRVIQRQVIALAPTEQTSTQICFTPLTINCRTPVTHLSAVHKTPVTHLSTVNKTPVTHLSAVHKTPVTHLSAVNKTPVSVTHLSTVHKTPVTHLSTVHKTPVTHLSAVHKTPVTHLSAVNKTPVTHLSTKSHVLTRSWLAVVPTTRASPAAASMSTSASGQELGPTSVQHDISNQEFVIELGQDRAVLQYQHSPEGEVDLWHTGVPTAFRGHGVAKILAQAALDYFSGQSTPMRLSCTYLQKYAKDFPQPAHQQYIVTDD